MRIRVYCSGYLLWDYRFLVVWRLYPRVKRYILSVSPVPFARLWLAEVSKVDAVDSDRAISPNIFADVWLVDRSCEGIVPHMCDCMCD